MARVNKIDYKNLQDLASVFNKLKMDEKPHVALSNKNIFETGMNIISMLEEIIDLAHQETSLTKRIGKSFRANPFLSWWYDENYPKPAGISITVNVSVPHSASKIKFLGAGIFFYNKNPKKFELAVYGQHKSAGDFAKEMTYSRKDLIFEVYSKLVIKNWVKWIS